MVPIGADRKPEHLELARNLADALQQRVRR